ncbi:MAG: type II secretion system protein N, partial [Rhodanobacteraceae bacterium]
GAGRDPVLDAVRSTQHGHRVLRTRVHWIPACAGMTPRAGLMRAANPNAGTSWPSRLPTILAWSALLLTGLLCIWMLVQLAWSLFTPLTPELTGTPARAPITQADSTQGDISRWHLFGNGNANALKRDIMEAGQATQLKLTLHGTVSEDQGQGGYALIADANGMEHSYRVGDRIQQGVSLKAVRADHVVLEHNGRNERLNLPRESLDSAASVRPLGHSGGTLTNSAGAQPGQTAGSDAATPIYVAPRINTGRVNWQQVQSDFERDPARAIANMQLQPVFSDGQLRGVRLGGGASNPLAAAYGLSADDVVTAVNGIHLDSIARGQQLFQQLRNAKHVQLTIQRNGQPQTLDIDLSKGQ